jgi:hypothetical protein
MNRLPTCALCLALVLLVLAACRREADVPQAQAPTPQPSAQTPATTTPAPVELKDVIETDPRYVIGISYPKGIDRYPGLATELQRYTEAARGELMQAVEGMGSEKPVSPYDLSLSYTMLVDTPQVVAVAADGSSYTGGAHGNPLVARFVWLPQQQKLLRANDLIQDATGWREVSAHVREQLHAALSQRIDADELEPVQRAEVMRTAGKMIDEGSDPDADNFDQFEPVLAADGRLRALRFVFPPYQVGPYSDGVQTVEVPASVLLPHVAAEYRGLFAAG